MEIDMLEQSADPSVIPAEMEVHSAKVFPGPHPYSANPMVQIRLALGALKAWPTDRLPGFSVQLRRTTHPASTAVIIGDQGPSDRVSRLLRFGKCEARCAARREVRL
ncbi:hypothetical protein X760_30100 [Mesorhizobium sp. LSHC422A00]|nr:hypothetical protein X760_30100 [Mesorhizobium sp. LSHC422A00]